MSYDVLLGKFDAMENQLTRLTEQVRFLANKAPADVAQFNQKEAAAYLGMADRTFRREEQDGYIRRGRKGKYSREELDRYIRESVNRKGKGE